MEQVSHCNLSLLCHCNLSADFPFFIEPFEQAFDTQYLKPTKASRRRVSEKNILNIFKYTAKP